MRQQRPEVPGALVCATSSATPLCSQQAVLHRRAFAKALHNTKVNAEKQCYTAVLATSSATPLCFCQNITQHGSIC
jgi:hypothetical protein